MIAQFELYRQQLNRLQKAFFATSATLIVTAALVVGTDVNGEMTLSKWVLCGLALFSPILSFIGIRKLNAIFNLQNKNSILFSGIKEGLIILEGEGRVLDLNPAACEFLGKSREEMLGHQLEGFFIKENNRPMVRAENPIFQSLQTREYVNEQVMGLIRPDGSKHWLKVNTSPLKSDHIQAADPLLVSFSDITDLKLTQKILMEQQSQMDSNAKLVALGEMAAGIAHEINNPLAIINGKVFMIQRGLSAGKFLEPLDQSVEKIRTTVERIQLITSGLQIYSVGEQQAPFEKVRLDSVIQDALSYCFEKLDQCQVQVELEIEQDLVLECRSLQISQCLVNLISNSCDAITGCPERWIRVWARSAHNMLVLKISDSGDGIPADIQSKIMQPFFTTKEVGKGTGLGLSITQGLIQSHLGKLWFDSKARNTTFVIELPIHQNPSLSSVA